MPRASAAFALFRRSAPPGDLWLAQWNDKWQAFNIIGGRRESNESSRDCATREVEEELSLTREKDFTIAEKPLARIDFEAFSVPAQEQMTYEMDLFAADFPRPAIAEQVTQNPANRWLSYEEIARGITADGQAISEVTQRFFQIR